MATYVLMMTSHSKNLKGGHTLYQYKNCTIVYGEKGIFVFSPDGAMHGPFSTEKDAEEFVDNTIE